MLESTANQQQCMISRIQYVGVWLRSEPIFPPGPSPVITHIVAWERRLLTHAQLYTGMHIEAGSPCSPSSTHWITALHAHWGLPFIRRWRHWCHYASGYPPWSSWQHLQTVWATHCTSPHCCLRGIWRGGSEGGREGAGRRKVKWSGTVWLTAEGREGAGPSGR